MRYTGDAASFIFKVPIGYLLRDCVPDVAPTGWCNSYQWLDDARAAQYSLHSVGDGGRHSLLSRWGQFGLRLTPAILYDRYSFGGESHARIATSKPDWPVFLHSELFPL